MAGNARCKDSTNPRQGGARWVIKHTQGAQRSAHRNLSRRAVCYLPNDGGPRPDGTLSQDTRCALRILRRGDEKQLSLVGDIERIEPQEFTSAANRLRQRNSRLLQHYGQAGGISYFMEHRRDATARRITQEMNVDSGLEQGLHQLVERCRVALKGSAKVQPSRADRTAIPWSPIVPLTSRRSPGRTR